MGGVGVGCRMLPTVHVLGIYDSHSLKSQLLAHMACAVLLGLVTQEHLSCHVWFAVLHDLNCPCDTTCCLSTYVLRPGNVPTRT